MDRDKALAWKRDQLAFCPGCRTRKEDWERDRDAFVGDIQHCPGCERLEQERENANNMGTKGLHIGLVPKELAQSADELERLG